MIDDLVNKLNDLAQRFGDCLDGETCNEAADTINRLSTALQKIAKHDLQAIALDALRPGERAALAGEKKDG